MTRQKSLKTRVRARMAKTGEAYTTARRHLLSHSTDADASARTSPADADVERGSPGSGRPAATHEPSGSEPRRFSDAVVHERTGKTWDEWFTALDAWGATERSHPEIARWLQREFEIGGWWAQGVTVEYERARGMRDYYQQREHYTANASKTVNVSVEQLFDAFAHDALRDRWAVGRVLRVRTARPHRSVRFDVDDGAARVVADFTAKGETKATVAVRHERLPDRAATDAAKRWWTERLTALKEMLEAEA